jgi:hypothetical protein
MANWQPHITCTLNGTIYTHFLHAPTPLFLHTNKKVSQIIIKKKKNILPKISGKIINLFGRILISYNLKKKKVKNRRENRFGFNPDPFYTPWPRPRLQSVNSHCPHP